MQNTFQCNKHGFTLVELAIVITIIGILIGGVLKGQQLIEQAEVAATISQARGYQTAVRIFETKYDALPGDIENPDNRIIGCTSCAATPDNLGDDRISNGISGSNTDRDSEGIRFWLHLYKADMITGVTDAALDSNQDVGFGTTNPASKLGGGFAVGGGDGGCNTGDWTDRVWGSSNGACQPSDPVIMTIRTKLDGNLSEGSKVMSPSQAAQIDRKMDDGRPLGGAVRGLQSDSGCADEDGNYDETRTDNDWCSVGFIMDF